MVRGFNSDLMVGGQHYHVQTEDWGEEKRLIVTSVFKQGAVIRTIKTPYSEILPNAHYDPHLIADAMKFQHNCILDQISQRQLL